MQAITLRWTPPATPNPSPILDADHTLRTLGPLRYAWRPFTHGAPAEALVRPWLAQALQVPDAALALQRDARGRPQLGGALTGFDASWSHSGGGLLMAVGEGVQVGADLEQLRPRPRALALARRYFAASEAATLAALSGSEREAAFVRLWCAKEAVLKAHGMGLVFGLHRLEFVREGDDWRLAACDPALGAPDDWRLHAFAPAPGYVAALASRAVR